MKLSKKFLLFLLYSAVFIFLFCGTSFLRVNRAFAAYPSGFILTGTATPVSVIQNHCQNNGGWQCTFIFTFTSPITTVATTVLEFNTSYSWTTTAPYAFPYSAGFIDDNIPVGSGNACFGNTVGGIFDNTLSGWVYGEDACNYFGIAPYPTSSPLSQLYLSMCDTGALCMWTATSSNGFVAGDSYTVWTGSIAENSSNPLPALSGITLNIYEPSADVLPSISFAYPTNGTTTAGDFADWDLNIENATGTTISAQVGYYDSTQNLTGSDAQGVPSGSYSTSITKSTAFKLGDSVNATAYLIENGTTAASSSITFTIGTSSNAFASSTTGIPSSTLQCSNGTFISNSFCDLLVFLFVPSQPYINQFNNLSSTLETKPPIGYFTLISNDLNGLAVGTTTIILLDATATAAFAPVVSPIYSGATILLWFLFALWLFNRIRHLRVTNP